MKDSQNKSVRDETKQGALSIAILLIPRMVIFESGWVNRCVYFYNIRNTQFLECRGEGKNCEKRRVAGIQ